jgi:tetratricopeptide (TPR) repeat protein
MAHHRHLPRVIRVFDALLLFVAGLFLFAASAHAQEAKFVGSASCAQCHKVEHKDWLGSHHAVAMQVANDQTVLGRFDGATFDQNGVKSSFFKKDGKFRVRTDGPDGKLADFDIAYTFGVAPLQQYLIALPNGRLQALGIAWDARPAAEGGQRWFHLYPDRKLGPGDPLHWTGIDQNWNYQCAWCHSTNLQKNHDPATGGFHTTWSEISVGCEACHGPASNHLEWAKAPGGKYAGAPGRGFAVSLDERNKAAWTINAAGQPVRSSPRATAKEIEVCAGCHARRQQFAADPAEAGKLFDAFRPSTLAPGLYYPDGQQRDEVYNYASFLQSKMFAAGVTCSDCHNPHSGKLKLAGNAVCSQCHSPARYDQTAHHHHAPDSKGAQCAACHMPTTTYMGVHARQDHSMRIPRPDRTVAFGSPNACNKCHADNSADWAAQVIKTWFPQPNPGAQSFAEAFDLADRNAPGARAGLMRVAEDGAQSAIARASAFDRLARTPSPEAVDLATRALASDDPTVVALAISVLSGVDAATRRRVLPPLLRAKTRLVRMEAARALAGEPEQGLGPDDRAAFDKALAEYVSGQLFNAERPESHANLGSLYLERGQRDAARAAYEKAIAIDPTFTPAAIALAELTRRSGDEAGAQAILQKAQVANPKSGEVAHALGLSYIRQKRLPDALGKLREAAGLEPNDPRFAYVYAIALHDTGQPEAAIDVLKGALARQPYDRNSLSALASYEVEAKDFSAALAHVETLAKLEPDNAEIQRFLAALKKMAE